MRACVCEALCRIHIGTCVQESRSCSQTHITMRPSLLSTPIATILMALTQNTFQSNNHNHPVRSSLSILHYPEPITQVVDILYTHTFVDLQSARIETIIQCSPSLPSLPPLHPLPPSPPYMSSVDSWVMPTHKACSFPSAMTACHQVKDNVFAYAPPPLAAVRIQPQCFLEDFAPSWLLER